MVTDGVVVAWFGVFYSSSVKVSAARANMQEFSAKVSKSVAAVGVASALLASVRLEWSSRYAYRDRRWG